MCLIFRLPVVSPVGVGPQVTERVVVYVVTYVVAILEEQQVDCLRLILIMIIWVGGMLLRLGVFRLQ